MTPIYQKNRLKTVNHGWIFFVCGHRQFHRRRHRHFHQHRRPCTGAGTFTCEDKVVVIIETHTSGVNKHVDQGNLFLVAKNVNMTSRLKDNEHDKEKETSREGGVVDKETSTTMTTSTTGSIINHAWLLERTKVNDLSRLQKLNLPNCGLSTLPMNLPKLVPNLSIIFLPKNHFEELPAVIGSCTKLQMVSFKDNGMKRIHPEALQVQLRWLILTGNIITSIPETIGRCIILQKLMLSGNVIESLPSSICKLKKLELVRLACNQLKKPPIELLKLQNLRWIALSNNPFLIDNESLQLHINQQMMGGKSSNNNNEQQSQQSILPILNDPELEDDKWPILGQGAGGITRKVEWKKQMKQNQDQKDNSSSSSSSSTDGTITVAVKMFSGQLTSDGSPEDERKISVIASSSLFQQHQHQQQNENEKEKDGNDVDVGDDSSNIDDLSLIRLLGQTRNKNALVMEYLQDYQSLALPPSLETCSRDVYHPNATTTTTTTDTNNTTNVVLTKEFCWYVGISLLHTLQHLHLVGICHGDFYGHNILIRPSTYHVKLSDFGASFFYPPIRREQQHQQVQEQDGSNNHSDYSRLIQIIELRSYLVLIQELYDHYIVSNNGDSSNSGTTNGNDNDNNNNDGNETNCHWKELIDACQNVIMTEETTIPTVATSTTPTSTKTITIFDKLVQQFPKVKRKDYLSSSMMTKKTKKNSDDNNNDKDNKDDGNSSKRQRLD